MGIDNLLMNLAFEDLIKKPIEAARATWEGATGDRRAEEVEKFIRTKTAHYAEHLGFTSYHILESMEATRRITAPNHYQEANYPNLTGVFVFDNVREYLERFPSRRFICPSCEGISTDSSTCDSGIIVNGKPCDWKAYGFFRTLGKGFRFVLKDKFLEESLVYEIFKPVELGLKDASL
jgi:hypothetical protein